MKNNVYKLTVECVYSTGSRFTETINVAASSSDAAIKKGRAEVTHRYKADVDKVKIRDFACVEKIAEDLVT